MRQLTKGASANLTVLLTLSATGAPATGIAFGAVTAQLSKAGGAFAAKAVLVGDWAEVGSGVYTLAFSAANTDTLGEIIFTVNAATCTQFVGEATVVNAADATTAVDVLTCVVSGYVTGLDGEAVANQAVWARSLGVQYQGTIGLADSLVATKTNGNGQFFLTLARLAEVQVDIPCMDYARRLTVPNSSAADLFTIP